MRLMKTYNSMFYVTFQMYEETISSYKHKFNILLNSEQFWALSVFLIQWVLKM